jgi:hypothetical protein
MITRDGFFCYDYLMNKYTTSSSKTSEQKYFDAYKNAIKKYNKYIKAEKACQKCNNRKEKQKSLAIRNSVGYEFYLEAWEKLCVSWWVYGEELEGEKLLMEKLKLSDCEYKVDLAQYHIATKLSDKAYFEKRLKDDLDKKASILASLQYYNQKRHLNIVTVTLIVNMIAMIVNAVAMVFNIYFNLKK